MTTYPLGTYNLHSIERWNKAPAWNQKRAYARKLVLESIQIFIEEKGFNQTDGEEVASRFYQERQLPGIEGWIYDAEPGFSVAKIRRLRRLYREEGLPGLLVRYGKNKGKQRSIPPDIKIYLVACLKNTPGIRNSNIYNAVKKRFKPAPSRKSIDRFIDTWKAENPQLAMMIEDPRRWKNTMMAAFGDKSAGITHFCHTWEIDSTPADVITKDGKRCAIIGIIDVYSRRSIILIAPTSKSMAIAACLREAFISWGIPENIRMDNGKDYSSRHVQAITSALRINTPALPPYTPEAKPFIERLFRTYSIQLEELLPGYCGHSVADRQKIREQATWASKIMTPGTTFAIPLTMKEFQETTDKWIKIYETTPHRGLSGRTPSETAEQSPSHPPKIRDNRVLDILLAPLSEHRKVGKKGIAIDNEFFIAPELVEYIGKRIEARRDLRDAGTIYVFDALNGTYLCEAKADELEGQSLEDYHRAKRSQKIEMKEKTKALETLGISCPTPLQTILIDDHAHLPKKILPFQQEADNEAIREARKAVSDNKKESQIPPSEPAQVISFKSYLGDPTDNSWMTDEDLDKEFERAMEKSVK